MHNRRIDGVRFGVEKIKKIKKRANVNTGFYICVDRFKKSSLLASYYGSRISLFVILAEYSFHGCGLPATKNIDPIGQANRVFYG